MQNLTATSLALLLTTGFCIAQTATQFRDIKRNAFPVDGRNTSSLAIGDYNLDGALDIIYTDFTQASQVQLYKNDGRGNFTDVTATALPPTGSARGWKVAFFRADADPFPDIFLAMAGQNRLFLNQRNGTFKDVSATNLPLSARSSYGLDIGDVDGDGDQDIVMGNTSVQNELWLNNGRGVFTDVTGTNMPTGSQGAWDATLADVDGDKDLDVFFANSSNKPQQLYINNGKGVFKDETATRLPALSTSGRQCAAGDVDGDGDIDAFFGTFGGQDLLLINDGKGFFKDETATRLPSRSNGTYGAIMVDIDEDKDLDVLVGEFTSTAAPTAPISLLLNDGKGKFTDATATRMPNVNMNALNFAVGDLDFDQDIDIAYASWAGQNGVYFNHEGQVTADAAPVIGTTWSLDIYAQPGYGTLPQSGILLLGAGALTPRVQTPWGRLGIAPPWFVISGWAIPPKQSGKFAVKLPIPNDAKLKGVQLWWQGFHAHVPIDTRLMNVWMDTIQ